ncbi:hypothetical protein [Bdellovibrio sp. NC01]|uniref:hypothetical protein n=1 Tax=Bdellovibrio sp. NC01 TaxID=2220073 RepID=UPI00115A31A9|nr:hypothetical protein [Bdellovibrio sp. NC01]QDK38600.1 hypothetical protein DOE51_13930 [Bdellovibrio sp. NC01]
MKNVTRNLCVLLLAVNASLAGAQTITPEARRQLEVDSFLSETQNLINQNAKDGIGEALKHPSTARVQYAARLNALADQFGKEGGAFKSYYRRAAQFVLNANVLETGAVPSNNFTIKDRQSALNVFATDGEYITNAKNLLARVKNLKAQIDASKDADVIDALYSQIKTLITNFSPHYGYNVYVETTRSGLIDDQILVPQMRMSLQSVIKTSGQCPLALTEVALDVNTPTLSEQQFLVLTDLNTLSLVKDYKVMVALLDGPKGQGSVVANCPEGSLFSSSFKFDADKGTILDTYRLGEAKTLSSTVLPKVDSTELIQKLRAQYN